MGHSISYHVAEEIETELASSITDKNEVTSDTILQNEGLSIGTAWDRNPFREG